MADTKPDPRCRNRFVLRALPVIQELHSFGYRSMRLDKYGILWSPDFSLRTRFLRGPGGPDRDEEKEKARLEARKRAQQQASIEFFCRSRSSHGIRSRSASIWR